MKLIKKSHLHQEMIRIVSVQAETKRRKETKYSLPVQLVSSLDKQQLAVMLVHKDLCLSAQVRTYRMR